MLKQAELFLLIWLIWCSSAVLSVGESGVEEARRDEPSPQELINNPSTPINSLSQADVSANFGLIVSRGRENDLSDSQLNGLSPQNLKQLSSPDAMRRVSPENIKHLSGDQVSQAGPQSLSDSQLNSLSQQQLLVRDNFDKVPDKSKLDPSVLNQVLTQRAGTNVQFQTQGKPSTGKLLPTGFEFDAVPFVQVQTVRVMNGEQVRYENQRLKAKRAEQLEYQGAVSKKVFTLDADPIRLYVGQADEISAGCISANNVSNSNVFVNTSAITLSGQEANFRYWGKNNFVYKGVGENSFITAEPSQCFSPDYTTNGVNYTVASATLFSSSPTVIETIRINTTGVVNAVPGVGFGCVLLSPNSVYQFERDGVRDFSLRTGSVHQVCVRRNESQSFSRDCSSCSIVDLVRDEISTKGAVAFERIEPIFASKSLDGSAILDVADLLTDVQVETDSPEYMTRITFHASIVERGMSSETHRLLDINESVQSLVSFVGNYSVFYDDGSLFVQDGIINYSTNDGFEVVVLPPGSGLELLALIPFLFLVRRRGQVTLWIILGLFVLVMFGLLMYSLKPGVADTQSSSVVFDAGVLKSQLDSCLEQSTDAGLSAFGRTERFVFSKGNVLAPSDDEAVRELQGVISPLLEACVKDISVVGAEVATASSLDLDVLLADQEVLVTANYPVVAQRGAEQIKVQSFAARREVRLKSMLLIARALALSQKVTGMFDLTTAETPHASLLFFTKDGKVFTRITDRMANIKNQPFSMTVVSAR